MKDRSETTCSLEINKYQIALKGSYIRNFRFEVY